ncbi:unnamed protein product, partial [Brassica oleracea var. botrytis]
QAPADQPPKRLPCVALQRIEAEKKRHDDRRGYSRSDVPRTTFKPSSDSRSYSRREVSRVDSGRYYVRKENQTREHSILSRTAKSNSAYYRNNAPSFQYQAVERNRTSSDSSASRQIPMPQPVAPETRGDTPNNPGTYPQNVQSGEITPTRTLRERLGPTSAGTTSGSKERRSALARISEPPATTEQPARRTPSFESGRLQLNDNRATEAATDQGNMEPLSEERLPATLRLGSSITAPPTRRGIIPISPQNKEAGKRRVSKTPRRVVRRPRLIQSIRKPTEARSTTVTKRRLVVDKDPTLPCNKAGTSNAVSSRLRKKNGQPTTVFIPGITRGGVLLRLEDPSQHRLPSFRKHINRLKTLTFNHRNQTSSQQLMLIRRPISVNLCMKRPPEDPYRQPPQTYLLSQRFANLASNVGGNPLRRPDFSHQKLSSKRMCDRKNGKGVSTGTIVAIVIVPILLLSLGFGIWRRRKSYKAFTTENGYFSTAKRLNKTYNTAPPDNAGDDITTSGSLQFDYEAIEAATSNFHNTNKLGHGGFGEVYKGTFPNGTEIAVKRLSKTSGQGEREFKNEVLLVAKLQHRNLVRLLGFCVQGDEKILVYEFLPNKSLNYFLFGASTKRSQLDWTRRYKIIGGITRGILYLHQDSRLTIIHRDLKASNILLDADMNPKIADFGMARNFKMDQTEDNTRRVVGTFGYMPPEYVANGQFSTKSDVYSFGVLILEIIGGKKNSSFHEIDGSTGNLVTYVWRLWNNDSLMELVDPVIGVNYDKYEVIRCVHIGVRSENIPLAESFQPGPSTCMSIACSVNDVSITSILVIPESATFRFISASGKMLPALKSWMIVLNSTNQKGSNQGFCWTPTHRQGSSLLLPNKIQASLPNFYADQALPQQQLHSLTLFHLFRTLQELNSCNVMSSIATSPQLVFHYEMYSTRVSCFIKNQSVWELSVRLIKKFINVAP